VDVYYANTQPSGLTLTLDQSTVSLGDAVNLSGSFNDPQSNTSHLVTIVWNTGGESLDITTLSLAAGQTTFQASPQTYSATGTYTISVTVSGLDGTAQTATTSVTVNAAPEQVMIGSLVPTAWEYGDSRPGTFLLTRVGSTSSELTVNYTVKGTAPGTDYNLTGTATFGVGDSTTSLYVAPTGDGGNGDTVIVTLAPGSGYTVASGFSSGQVTISNNEVTGSGSPAATITCFNPDGTAEGSSASTMLGSFIPVSIAASGDTTGCTYYLSYSGDISVSASPGGSVIESGTEITLTSAGSIYYVSASPPDGDSEECGDVGITWTYDDGASGGGTSSTETFQPLQLFRDAANITNGTPANPNCNVKVGERINLSVGGRSAFVYGWSIPGVVVANYIANNSVGYVVPLIPNILSPSVSYVWAQGGTELVTATALTPWGTQLQAHATFLVSSPQGVVARATVNPTTNAPRYGGAALNGITADVDDPGRMNLGSQDLPGIVFSQDGLNSAQYYIAWCQVINSRTGTIVPTAARILTGTTWAAMPVPNWSPVPRTQSVTKALDGTFPISSTTGVLVTNAGFYDSPQIFHLNQLVSSTYKLKSGRKIQLTAYDVSLTGNYSTYLI
jgi:hypothetical protein